MDRTMERCLEGIGEEAVAAGPFARFELREAPAALWLPVGDRTRFVAELDAEGGGLSVGLRTDDRDVDEAIGEAVLASRDTLDEFLQRGLDAVGADGRYAVQRRVEGGFAYLSRVELAGPDDLARRRTRDRIVELLNAYHASFAGHLPASDG